MSDKLDFKGALEVVDQCPDWEIHTHSKTIQTALRIADRLQSGYVSYEMCDSFYDYIDDGTEEKTVSSIFIAMSAQLIKEETERN